ncbi:thiol:disulfide interchange protein DsbE [Halioxenophilus aromaticivorans]
MLVLLNRPLVDYIFEGDSMKRWMLFVPVIVFAVLAAFFWRGLSLDPTAMPSALVGKPMPQFELPALEQNRGTISSTELVGQPYLLNVWATWCPTCKAEHPFLVDLAESGVNIIGVYYRDDTSKADGWLTNLGNPYLMNIVDEDGKLGIDLGVFGTPETYFVDAAGVIRYKHVGLISQKNWQEELGPIYESIKG